MFTILTIGCKFELFVIVEPKQRNDIYRDVHLGTKSTEGA